MMIQIGTHIMFGLIGLIGVLASLALVIWIIVGGISVAVTIIQERHSTERRYRMRRAITELNSWCSYDFPIVEDIKNWILPIIDGEPSQNIGDFRTELQKKYGKK